jgi:glycosyltransferase involved in cell wall biosynthesis
MPKWRERELSVSLFGGGNNERALKRSVELHGLSSVRFGGHTAEIEQVWASHHALILPSRCEGLPLALVEAMLCGRISIVTDVGGNKELLEDNVTGFVAAWPKVEALDEALERAWQQRNEWRSMGVAAAECVRRQIPHDPIGVLFQEIEALVK